MFLAPLITRIMTCRLTDKPMDACSLPLMSSTDDSPRPWVSLWIQSCRVVGHASLVSSAHGLTLVCNGFC